MPLNGTGHLRGIQRRLVQCRTQAVQLHTRPVALQKRFNHVQVPPIQHRQLNGFSESQQNGAPLEHAALKANEDANSSHPGLQDHRIYNALPRSNSIRLLILESGRGVEPIQCQLEVADLSDIQEYEALSYTWGDAQITKSIICSGQRTPVTINLHTALLHLRHEDKPRVLWIDALCINQQDNAEKSQQVPLMSEIYSEATRVVIWLGEETEDVAGALETIPRMQRHYNKILRFRKWIYPSLFFLGPLSGLLMDIFSPRRTHPPDVNWKKFTKLLERPWFLRTWIIQEVVLPKEVMVCSGHVSITWDALQDVAWGIYTIGTANFGTPSFTRTLLALDLVVQERRKRHFFFGIGLKARPPRVVELLVDSRNFLCTNQRDKIYGLLGIAMDANEEGKQLLPDYSRSIEDVYKDFVIWNVLTRRSLSSFSLTSQTKASSSKSAGSNSVLPSWVPDFANLIESLTLLPLTTQETRRGTFDAAKGTDVMARFNKRNNTLCVWGITVDSVQALGQKEGLSPTMEKASRERLIVKAAVWLSECLSMAQDADAQRATPVDVGREKGGMGDVESQTKTSTTEENFFLSPKYWEKFWQTMMMEHNEQGVPVSRMYQSIAKQCIANMLHAPTALQTEAGRKRFHQRAWNHRRIWGVIAGRGADRRFMVTKGGRLGWAPLNAVPGDTICALYGGKLLYVLRDCGGGQFRLVGDCYVHGMMKGESMDQDRMRRDSREFEMV
ncbi:Fc.00g070950.m01.CDS01 [Cosmosporella sp. VM-42]